MRIAHYPQTKLNSQIKEILSKYLDLKNTNLFYFGSRVTGKGDERSDIDIGILGKGAISPKKLIEIKEEIDALPILYSIDLVDFNDVSDNFKTVAMKKVEYIN